jgi:soluble lytic murein transglycosylase-like protein
MRALPSDPARHQRPTALPGALRALALAVLALLFSPATRAQIYGGTDDSGAVLLSNHEPAGEFVVLVEAPPAPPPVPAVVPAAAPRVAPTEKAAAVATPLAPKLLTPIIREAARKHALPEALLNAMVSVESGFDDRAVSPKGAKGLMQLMPDTARRFGVKDVFSADQNVHAGAAYMRILLNQFSDDMQLALAAYNAGEGAVMRAGRRIPAYPETQQYVRKVMAQAALALDPNAASRR